MLKPRLLHIFQGLTYYCYTSLKLPFDGCHTLLGLVMKSSSSVIALIAKIICRIHSLGYMNATLNAIKGIVILSYYHIAAIVPILYLSLEEIGIHLCRSQEHNEFGASSSRY